MTKLGRIRELLSRNVEQVIERAHLEKALRSGKKLRVKLGIDPTSPDLHLGHAVILRKMKEFQDLGHQIVLIIGDFTGKIGDPSGRSDARKPLTDAEVNRNKKDYLVQAGKIIDVKKAEVRHNSEWFKREGVAQLITLAGAGSMQQVLRRADFRKRLKADQDITLLETLYPLLQGYDSVKVRADIELGGNDQLFNLLMGRRVQRYFGEKEQDVLTVSLLEGLDGKKKMSKSAGNYIGLTENPDTMVGKTMTLPDNLIPRYFLMCTELDEREVKTLESKLSPRDFKLRLAKEIVELYHSKSAAEKAAEKWQKIFSKREIPKDIEEYKFSKNVETDWLDIVWDIGKNRGILSSRAEAWRLIEQGGFEKDGRKITKPRDIVRTNDLVGSVLRVGKKKFFKIKADLPKRS